MKRYKIIVLAMLACAGLNGWAQDGGNVTGKVVDKMGNPVEGALVFIENNPLVQTTTDRYGTFEIAAEGDNLLRVRTGADDTKVVPVESGKIMTIVMDYSSQKVNYGFGLGQTNAESTGAVSTVYAEDIDNRSAFNIGNSLYGNVAGLTTLQKTGNVWEQIPTQYVRGLKTLNGNNGVLLVIDGLERDNNWNALNYITPEEVESVSVLRDAAAVALYGYRGVNGVINIVTKRGKYKSREISFSYDHGFNYQTRTPEMADAYTYALAMNEALANDGRSARYNSYELEAFRSGQYPYLYPNVNWIDEVMRDRGTTDIATLTFRGGSTKMRYFTLLNLQNNRGFINNANVNEYSTQQKYSKANFRSNLDIDLTSSTRMQVNIMGMLNEHSVPGSSTSDLWNKLYTVPSAAFPIRTESGLWGGNATWDGYHNPVALTQGRGYTKGHARALYADMMLRQDLSSLTKGLGVSMRMGYDNIATFTENNVVDYRYGMQSVTAWAGGQPSEFEDYTGGSVSSISGDNAYLNWQHRSFNFHVNADWQRTFGQHDIYTMLLYTYKYDNMNGTNTSLYTQNVGWYTHYGFKKRYFLDFTLMASASNRIDPDSRWMPVPTVGLAWVISNEDFMRNQSVIDFMKLRASFGIIAVDNVPYNGYWNATMGGGGGYPTDNDWGYDDGSWAEGTLPSVGGTLEKAYKYNVGLDMSLLKGLSLSIDGFYERRSDIWVSAAGLNSSILGASNSYANAGIVDSWGTEIALDYSKRFGDFQVSVGGNFSLARNEVVEMLEEAQRYEYLRQTGRPVGQLWALQATGYFYDDADVANSKPQAFGPVQAGDLKYKDVNNDGVVDSNDMVPMGYNSSCPEIYYGFNLGFEWKGLGFNAYFQGVGRYSTFLTGSIYRPLVNNTNISEYAYENRWTPENPTARYPRLTTQQVDNNTQNSSVWLANRSYLKLRNCEVYYKLPQNWLERIRLKTAKVYVRGTDLFSIDNIDLSDPEAIGDAIPATRSIHVGLSVGI